MAAAAKVLEVGDAPGAEVGAEASPESIGCDDDSPAGGSDGTLPVSCTLRRREALRGGRRASSITAEAGCTGTSSKTQPLRGRFDLVKTGADNSAVPGAVGERTLLSTAEEEKSIASRDGSEGATRGVAELTASSAPTPNTPAATPPCPPSQTSQQCVGHTKSPHTPGASHTASMLALSASAELSSNWRRPGGRGGAAQVASSAPRPPRRVATAGADGAAWGGRHDAGGSMPTRCRSRRTPAISDLANASRASIAAEIGAGAVAAASSPPVAAAWRREALGSRSLQEM